MSSITLSDSQIKQFIDEYWYGLGDMTKVKMENVFLNNSEFVTNPTVAIIDILRKPENFAYTCKLLLNVKLLPFQVIILQQLWNHAFPMLTASRGASKSFTLAVYCLLKAIFQPGSKIVISGSSFRQAKIIFSYIENIWKNAPVLKSILSKEDRPSHDTDMYTFRIGESSIISIPLGCLSGDTFVTTNNGIFALEDLQYTESNIYGHGLFKKVGHFFDNGVQKTLKIKTEFGYEFISTENHKMRVCRKNEIVWVRADEMKLGDRILIDRTDRWHFNDNDASIDDCYCLGLMIGDGNYTNPKYLRFTNTYPQLLESLNKCVGHFRYHNDGNHYQLCGKSIVKAWLDFWGLDLSYAHQKSIPKKMLMGNKNKMVGCLQGLFDTDGHVSFSTAKGGIAGSIGYTTTSQKLARQIHYILLHFGIISNLRSRVKKNKQGDGFYKRIYELLLTGNNVRLFYQKIGFRHPKKVAILNYIIDNKERFYSYNDTIPYDLKNIERKGICYRRQKLTFDRLEKVDAQYIPEDLKLLNNKNYYYDTIDSIQDNGCINTYDIHVPLDNEYCANGFYSHNSGDRIRGLRASCLLADEFNSIDVNIFEEVLRGFTSVSLNPYDSVLEQSKLLALKELGKISEEEFNKQTALNNHNQIIISGTCGFTFENLYKYWRKYHDIIMTGGDKAKLGHIFNSNIPEGFNWKDFCIIRLPYTLLPKAFMDEKSIGQAQATSSQAIFDSEYGVVFISDTDGFFKRTLIESCVCRNTTPPVSKPSCGILEFNASLKGEPDCEYILACDPAAARDNLSIVLLELRPDHRRVKYCWTINDKKHKLRIKYGLAAEYDYYRYCVRKMRDLMRTFRVKAIALDAQGGGKALIEIFGDPSYLNVGEHPIYPIIEKDVDKPTDNLPGLHILHAIQFSNADWVYDANHGLRQDMETRELIFPLKDSLAYGLAREDDKIHNRIIIDEEHSEAEDLGDTLEDCLLEIEELKNELTLIEHSKTPNGRDKWDTPQVKGLNNKKGRLLKDRYSALLMANALGRSLIARTVQENVLSYGGTAQSFRSKQDKKHKDNYGMAVRRGGGRY